MKTLPLDEILKQITPLPYSAIRIHPHVDVGNGDGHQPMPEISAELQGGDWYDIGYCHDETVRNYLTHAANGLPELVEALRGVPDTLEALADDSEEAGWGARARNARKLAESVRDILARATSVPVNS